MKTTRFNELPLSLKSKVISEFASPLFSIEYYDHRIDLFGLNSLLIERYEAIESGEVEKITEADHAALDKYLPWIVIGDLKKRLKNH